MAEIRRSSPGCIEEIIKMFQFKHAKLLHVGHGGPSVRVIDHEPQFWFLFEYGEKLLFSMSCESSFVGYDFAMFLTDDEISEYRNRGRAYLHDLAEKVNYSAPIMKTSSSIYKSRRITNEDSAKVAAALAAWKKSSETRASP